MSTASTSPVASAAAANAVSAKTTQALTSDDFLKMMITELTNQDPFEPMKNQELLNQMATLQKLESDRSTTKSFDLLIDKFTGLIDRETLSTATRMIGELVSGTATDGQYTMGRVIAVGMNGSDVQVELDTGQKIAWDKVSRLGGKSQQDLVGTLVVGQALNGARVTGTVEAVELQDKAVILHVRQNQLDGTPGELQAVNLQNARIMTAETADLLIGQTVIGYDQARKLSIQGTVDSVQWTGDRVLLNLLNSGGEVAGQVALQDMIDISSMSL